ncbi:MAG: hypothetical protein WA982_13105 [Rubrobacteraceae bacterium]
MGREGTVGSKQGKLVFSSEPEAHAYTDGASTETRGPGGYGAIVT